MPPSTTNFRTLDLNLLRVFDAVMTERNVTRAAARLAITQPAVSNAMRRLREATHEELFVPGASGVTPTAQAQQLWPVVRAALEQLQGAFEPQGFDPQADARSFTLAMADATSALVVPWLVNTLRREQARVDLRITGLTSRDPRPLLEQGQADVALGFFPDVGALLAAEGEQGVMRQLQLYSSEYVCVMRSDHPLAAQSGITLDDFCAAEHLRVSFAGRPRGFVDEALSRLGRARRVVVAVNEFFTAGAVVHQSDLLAVLPRSFVPATGFAAQLATRALPFDLPGIDITMLWHRRHEQDAAQRWLRDTLVRAAAEIAATA